MLSDNPTARDLLWPESAERKHAMLPKAIVELLSNPDAQCHLVRIGGDHAAEISISKLSGRPSRRSLRGLAIRDITKQKRGERHLVRLAHYDSLTGLGNRRLFVDRLDRAIASATEGHGQTALLYLDLDRFKSVNDTLGHAVGDTLLKTVSKRMTTVLRESNTGNQTEKPTVSRLSGDEFAVVVPLVRTREGIESLANQLLDSIAQPIETSSGALSPSGSIGIAIYPEDANDVETLVKHADTALYVAKDKGRGRVAFFESKQQARHDRTNRIEDELRFAIERREFSLHYQPKVGLESNTVVGFEALIRWYSRELGFVGPKEFIPIAEANGLILEIGEWALNETCRQLRVWQNAGFATVPVSVNVSGAQFRDTEVENVVGRALVAHDVHPAMIEIELTESLLLEDDNRIATALRDLRAIGVRVSLDDFGTGYSALTYLDRFPLDVVKMDRGFIRDIEDSSSAENIAAAVVSLSHSLGFEVVAEGVDSPPQAALLRRMGCDQIQGFLFSPAIPGEEATQFLANEGMTPPAVKTIFGRFAHDLEDTIREADDDRDLPIEPGDARIEMIPPSVPPRLLVIDSIPSTLGQTAFRLTQLAADVHLMTGIDEARLFVDQEEPAIDLIIAPPDIPLRTLDVLVETIEKQGHDHVPRVLICGQEPDSARRESIRKARVDYVLWEPFADPELRFFINAARSNRSWKYRRQTVRVPVESLVWLRAGANRASGVITSLSRRGAQIETSGEFTVGQPIRLEFKIETRTISVFANVTRAEPTEGADDDRELGWISVIFYEVDDVTDASISDYVEQLWLRFRP